MTWRWVKMWAQIGVRSIARQVEDYRHVYTIVDWRTVIDHKPIYDWRQVQVGTIPAWRNIDVWGWKDIQTGTKTVTQRIPIKANVVVETGEIMEVDVPEGLSAAQRAALMRQKYAAAKEYLDGGPNREIVVNYGGLRKTLTRATLAGTFVTILGLLLTGQCNSPTAPPPTPTKTPTWVVFVTETPVPVPTCTPGAVSTLPLSTATPTTTSTPAATLWPTSTLEPTITLTPFAGLSPEQVQEAKQMLWNIGFQGIEVNKVYDDTMKKAVRALKKGLKHIEDDILDYDTLYKLRRLNSDYEQARQEYPESYLDWGTYPQEFDLSNENSWMNQAGTVIEDLVAERDIVASYNDSVYRNIPAARIFEVVLKKETGRTQYSNGQTHANQSTLAIGFSQIMPFQHLNRREGSGSETNAYHPKGNLLMGATILGEQLRGSAHVGHPDHPERALANTLKAYNGFPIYHQKNREMVFELTGVWLPDNEEDLKDPNGPYAAFYDAKNGIFKQ